MNKLYRAGAAGLHRCWLGFTGPGRPAVAIRTARFACLRLALAAATSLSLSGFGFGDIFGGGISERQYNLADLGLGFLTSDGRLDSISGLGGFETLAGLQSTRLKAELKNTNAKEFFSEYDVVGKDPIKYNQVGMEQLDRLWREGARATAASAIGRKLVSRVTANLIKLNQTAALGAEITAAEQDTSNTDDATQAVVQQKILARLKENRDKIDAQHRQALIRMHIAALGAAIAAMNAQNALPQAVSATGGATGELAQLPSKFISNPLEAMKVPGIIEGTQRMIDSINKLSQDLPAFIKNCNVLFLALGELAAPAEEEPPGQMQVPTTQYPEKK